MNQLIHFFFIVSRSIALKVSGFEWNIIEPCFRWMQPFYDVICESSEIFLLEKHEQVNSTSDSHHICPNMVTDDSHIIQTHNTSLDMLVSLYYEIIFVFVFVPNVKFICNEKTSHGIIIMLCNGLSSWNIYNSCLSFNDPKYFPRSK